MIYIVCDGVNANINQKRDLDISLSTNSLPHVLGDRMMQLLNNMGGISTLQCKHLWIKLNVPTRSIDCFRQ